MSIGEGEGENRATQAAKMAVTSPLLDLSIDGAKGVLFVISGGPDLTMNEVNEIATIITSGADDNAKIIFGANIDETLRDRVRVTLVATGFGEAYKKARPIERGSWGDKINNIFMEKPANNKDEGESPKFNSRSIGSDEPKVSKIRVESEEPKKSFFGFGSRAESDEDLEVPPIIRRGGSFKPKEIAVPEEGEREKAKSSHSFFKRQTDGFNLDEAEEDDLELPSFIRKKMK
jgi:cell division protein FtsZ